MIHINLLPVRAKKKREFGQQLVLLFAVLVVATLVGNYLWYRSVDDSLNQVNRQIDATRAQITQLEKTIGEVKTITQDKKALEDKLKVLDTLKKGRTGPVKVLDEMSTVIPARVWVGDFDEKAGQATIRGFAVAYEDLSLFVQKLKTSKFFSDVSIKKASQKTDSGSVDWEITCRVNYSA
jgi:type IV pilus assembly protein PilN